MSPSATGIGLDLAVRPSAGSAVTPRRPRAIDTRENDQLLSWKRYQAVVGRHCEGARMALIERIETVALRVPLDRIYRGSYYKMRNRCTILTTVRTSDGLIGQAYNADTDE